MSRLYDRLQDKRRGTATQRGYDAVWRRLRLLQLHKEPLCRFCAQMGRSVEAQAVDHIVSIKEAPHLRLEPSNLRSLCKRCHDQHTARTQGFAKNSVQKNGCDKDGNPLDAAQHWR